MLILNAEVLKSMTSCHMTGAKLSVGPTAKVMSKTLCNPQSETKNKPTGFTRLHTPHAADEGAPGAHAHPHGGLLSFLLHCSRLQVQNPSCRREQQLKSAQGKQIES